MVVCRSLMLAFIAAASMKFVSSRAVNISSVWLLPEEGFPVFYRYFRDRITWFEADAVCQFHHANLVTVDSSEQYDATRAYLKELDVVNNVWVGLKRSGSEGEFTWTDYKPLENGGYWQEQIPMTDNPVCAAMDPSADFRWHPLSCGGPEVASFICQLEVPGWARKEDGCMVTSLPSLTVTFLPEQGAVELISDCGLEGTRRIACKGQANREEMMKQLSCEAATEIQTEATASNTWDNDLPTRHRRDTEVTVDMASVQHFVPTTQGLSEVNSSEATDTSTPAKEIQDNPAVDVHGDLQASTSVATSTQVLPEELCVAEEPVKTVLEKIPDEPSKNNVVANISAPTQAPPFPQVDEALFEDNPIQIPLNSIAKITAEEPPTSQEEQQSGDKRQILVQSKPIPPSLRGNSPFPVTTLAPNKVEPSVKTNESTTQRPAEKESHEVFRESKADMILPEKKENKPVNFPPLTVYNTNNNGDPDESSARVARVESTKATGEEPIPTLPVTGKTENSETKFFTRVVAEETTTTVASVSVRKSTAKPDTENDFFIATEIPLVSSEPASTKQSTTLLTEIPTKKSADVVVPVDINDGSIRPAAFSAEHDAEEMADEAAPEVPERPNRGRLLVRPQHHSFYPYFLNRVLG